MHLILAARREDAMRELANDVHMRHGTKTHVIPVDLSTPSGVQELFDQVQQLQLDVELLVNNAGFGIVGEAEKLEIERVEQMLRLNILAVTRLTKLFLPAMVQRERGAIVNVASVAAFQPVAYMASYAASKAYVLHFSEAVWAEVRDRGVTVMGLCPGVTRTDFFSTAGVPNWLKKHSSQTPDQVVKAALKGLDKGRQYYVSGWKNYLLSVAVRLATRRIAVTESKKYFRPQSSSDSETESQ